MNPLAYDAIFLPQIGGKIESRPVPGETLTALLEFAAGSRRLHPEIEIDFALLGVGEIGGRFAIDAPHYLCLYSAAAGREKPQKRRLSCSSRSILSFLHRATAAATWALPNRREEPS